LLEVEPFLFTKQDLTLSKARHWYLRKKQCGITTFSRVLHLVRVVSRFGT